MRKTKTIRLGNRMVDYVLVKTARARGIRLAIYPGGEIRVSAPRYMADAVIAAFLLMKAPWIAEKTDEMVKVPKLPPRRQARERYERLKEKARVLVHERLGYFNRYYGYTYHTVAIRDQKTRWGSCSAKGNLNFSYKLAILPPELTDYVVVHELCHLREMNHSKRFWDLVHRTIPDYRTRKRHLKERASEFDV